MARAPDAIHTRENQNTVTGDLSGISPFHYVPYFSALYSDLEPTALNGNYLQVPFHIFGFGKIAVNSAHRTGSLPSHNFVNIYLRKINVLLNGNEG